MAQNNDTKPENNEPKDHIDELLDEEELQKDLEKFENEEFADDENASLRKKLKEAEEKLLRQAANTDNYMKRLAKETDEKIKYANQSLIAKFLPVLDNFDLALQHGETSSLETLLEGVKLNQKALIDTLAKVGLVEIEANIGDIFDPNTHEAIMLTNNAELPDNSIAMVAQKGYSLEGRIVRPVKVQVNKL